MANKYAVIVNNNVENVIMADSKEIAEIITGLSCVEVVSDITVDGHDYGVFIGCSYDNETNEFSLPSWFETIKPITESGTN